MTPFSALIGPIGWPELVVIAVIVLIIFGPRRLPEIAEAFGKSIGKFRKATHDATEEVKKELDEAAHEAGRDKPHHDDDQPPGPPHT